MVVYSLLCKSGEVCRDPAHTGAPGLGIQAMQLRLGRLEVSRASPGSHEMKVKVPVSSNRDSSKGFRRFPIKYNPQLFSESPFLCDSDHPNCPKQEAKCGFFYLSGSCTGLTGDSKQRLRNLGSTVHTGKHWFQTILNGPMESPWVSPAYLPELGACTRTDPDNC